MLIEMPDGKYDEFMLAVEKITDIDIQLVSPYKKKVLADVAEAVNDLQRIYKGEDIGISVEELIDEL
jgi:hypothetical protein